MFLPNAYKGFFICQQSFLNDGGYGKKGVLPFKYGIVTPYNSDKIYDKDPLRHIYGFIDDIKEEDRPPDYPKSTKEIISQALNPYVVHQWNGKWSSGKGMSIFRRLAQYYLKLAGIWEETCIQKPKFCYK